MKTVCALNRLDETKESLLDLVVCLGMATSVETDDAEELKQVISLAIREIQQACDDLGTAHEELYVTLQDETL